MSLLAVKVKYNSSNKLIIIKKYNIGEINRNKKTQCYECTIYWHPFSQVPQYGL